MGLLDNLLAAYEKHKDGVNLALLTVIAAAGISGTLYFQSLSTQLQNANQTNASNTSRLELDHRALAGRVELLEKAAVGLVASLDKATATFEKAISDPRSKTNSAELQKTLDELQRAADNLRVTSETTKILSNSIALRELDPAVLAYLARSSNYAALVNAPMNEALLRDYLLAQASADAPPQQRWGIIVVAVLISLGLLLAYLLGWSSSRNRKTDSSKSNAS